jgi:hypothetical protein
MKPAPVKPDVTFDDLRKLDIRVGTIDPNVAKVGGLQSQGVNGEAVVAYCDPLTTQDLKSSGFPVG